MASWLAVFKEVAQIWAVITTGTLIGVGFIAASIYIPPVRQLCVGLAVAAFVATAAFTWGVKKEHDVVKAQQARAELLRQQRDALQDRLAKEDEARRAAGLDEMNRREQESESDYEKRLAARKVAPCPLTDDDLR